MKNARPLKQAPKHYDARLLLTAEDRELFHFLCHEAEANERSVAAQVRYVLRQWFTSAKGAVTTDGR